MDQQGHTDQNGNAICAETRGLRSVRLSLIVVCQHPAHDDDTHFLTWLTSLNIHLPQQTEKIAVLGGTVADPIHHAAEQQSVRVLTTSKPDVTLAQLLSRGADQAIGQYLIFLELGQPLTHAWDSHYRKAMSGQRLVGQRRLCLHGEALAQLATETPDSFLDWRGLAIPRGLFEMLGGFDRQFEDLGLAADLCWRAWDAGAAIGCVTPVLTPVLTPVPCIQNSIWTEQS